MISEELIGVDPEKIACVKDWPVLKSVKQVQGFLAKITKPLHAVTQGSEHVKLKTKNAVRHPPLKWGESQQQLFKNLRTLAIVHPYWVMLSLLLCTLTGRSLVTRTRWSEQSNSLCK